MFREIIKKLAVFFGKKKIPYMIIGGQAVLYYGSPRLTKDIDITLGIATDRLSDILGGCKALKLQVLPENPADFAAKTQVLPARDIKTGIRVDFIFSITEFEKQAIARSKKIRIGQVRTNFASIEDLIIYKIFAGRASDIEDVKFLICKNKGIDLRYIRKWLREFSKNPSQKGICGIFENILRRRVIDSTLTRRSLC